VIGLTDEELREQVAWSAALYRVPGMSVAVIHGDEIERASYGVLNVETKVDVTDDSLFQIGSITKVFTGTLAMQFVESGALELDAPVRRYLPDLRIAGRPLADAITVRMLLTHSSGIVGDFFIDTGRNDDATRLYVERCDELEYLTEPGVFSYCNSGYGILGRIIEVLSGKAFVKHLRDRLLGPLEITALTDPEDSMLYRIAAGHILDETGALRLTPTPFLPRATEAAGSRLTMSASSLLTFARMHLGDGLGANGSRIISAESARAMRTPVVPLPVEHDGIGNYGLSWAIYDSFVPQAVGHNGGTIGQSAFLRLCPERGFAIAALANVSSPGAGSAFDDIVRAVAAKVGSIAIRDRPHPSAHVEVNAAPLVGRYDTLMSTLEITRPNGNLALTVTSHYQGEIAALPPRHFVLEPIDATRFLAHDVSDGSTSVAGFVAFDGATPGFFFWGGRLAKRASDAASLQAGAQDVADVN